MGRSETWTHCSPVSRGTTLVLFGVDFTAASAEVTPETHARLFDLGREHPAEGAGLQQ